jgi:hypothetical protein
MHLASGRPTKMPHAHAVRLSPVTDIKGCPAPRAGQRPSRRRRATRASSWPGGPAVTAGYPPAQISQIRTTTGNAATAMPSTHIGGSRAPTVASDCDAASLAFPNVCFLPNLAQADDYR